MNKEIVKNLLKDKTCDKCYYYGVGGCTTLYWQNDFRQTSLPTGNTCTKWKNL
jgi:hypothetical protein